MSVLYFLAEKEGFEPSIPFWGIHDFQSCALGQLRDFSMWRSALADFDIIHDVPPNVKHYFSFFQKNFLQPYKAFLSVKTPVF